MIQYRTLFISDVHLGTRAAQADLLLDFLKETEADTIYLVGDIVDFWRIRRGAIWPQSHNDVLQKLLRKVRKGTRVVFIPGNHDEGLRQYCGQHFGGIEIEHQTVHTTADGKRYLVIHGDEFDVVVRYAKWLAFLGDRGYELALWMNHPLNFIRRRFGLGFWSLSAHLKLRVKTAVNFIGEFEKSLSDEARRHHVDGVICGHIHHAASRDIDGIHYLNTGDWVESCTAIGERADGTFEMIRWHEVVSRTQGADRGPARRSAPGRVMRILVATDAWHPQVNGVVRTYERLAVELAALGVEMTVLAPQEFHTVPCPTYPEIRLALPGFGHIARRFRAIKPDAVHIATEGPLGWMARRYCRAHGIRFTTSFHTRFPEYLNQRFAIPTGWTAAVLRRFHNAGAGLMVATPSLGRELEAYGFQRVLPWTRGVDTNLFRPRPVRLFGEAPVFLYVGRIAAEKSIADFLDLDLPGRKVVVGGGPQLDELRAKYPGRPVHRQADRRGAGRVLRLGRRVRLSQPHRHVRHGAAGSHGVGLARRGAARLRAAGRGAQRRYRRAVARPARGGPRRTVARSHECTCQGGGI